MLRAAAVLVAASCILLTGCQTSVPGAASPATGSSWPRKDQPSAVGTGSPPAFPSTLSHWSLRASWSDTLRTFTGEQTAVSGPASGDYPATMNGCGNQRFLVRWRVVDGATKVTANLLDEMGAAEAHADGTAGWMDGHGCVTPAFEVVPTGDGNALIDVSVQVQQWVSAP